MYILTPDRVYILHELMHFIVMYNYGLCTNMDCWPLQESICCLISVVNMVNKYYELQGETVHSFNNLKA